MVRTGIQLYTLHDFDVSQADRIRIAGETDVEGVEIVFSGSPSQETRDALVETDLETLGMSVGLEDIEERSDEVVAACEALNSDTVILGHLGESYVESLESVRETGALLSSFADQFAKEGLGFMYHTHRYEFETTDDRLHFDLLLEVADEAVDFEVDLGWAAVSGVDPPSILRTYGDRIRSVHLKDMRIDTEEFVNLGDGDLNVKVDAIAAMEAGVERLIYEHENPSDPIESVVNGASTLQKASIEADISRVDQ